jgi:hypothetical protein
MPDYTIGIAERIASLPDSFATSNSVNRNYFQETNQSVINKVTVALAPDTPTALDPNPDTEFASSTDGDSVDTYGQQDGPLFITLLATIEEAGELSQYLLRADPAFWFSNLAISLNTLSEANKNIVANLEIGQQIAVTKTFPAGVVPQSVTEYLFVEGISHRVTPETHVVTIYTGPATTYLQWLLGNYSVTQTRTNRLTNPNIEVDTFAWFAQGAGSTIARSTNQQYVGSASLLWSYPSTLANPLLGANPGNGSNRIPVTAGQTYTFSIYVYTDVVSDYRADIRWATAVTGGTVLDTLGTASAITANTWTRYSVTGTAPAGYPFAQFNTVRISNTVTGTTYVDAALVETGSSVLPYFDGTYDDPYTDYTLTFQAWDGTANTSTSTTVWGLNSSGTGSALGDSTYGLA